MSCSNFPGASEEEGIPDVEEIEDIDEEVINETLFTFEAFEAASDHSFLSL